MQVITRFDRGGSSEVVLQLARALQGDRFLIHIAHGPTRDPQEDLEQFHRETGIPMHVISHLRRDIHPWQDLVGMWQLYRLLRRERPTILHTHTSKAGFLGRVAGFLARVPVIIHTPHGHVFYGYFGPATSTMIVYLERFAARFTDRIVTLTEAGRQQHIGYRIAAPEKFVPIYCGIDLSRFRRKSQGVVERLKKEFCLEGRTVVGSVGRLDPIKGYDDFIRACALVKQSHPKTVFLLAGDGPLLAQLKALASELGLGEAFVFAGARKDVPELLSLFDLFVLSSLNEGLGRVLMEAAAVGIPVVATRVGGVPEIVLHQQTGWLVPPKNPQELARAICTLLDDPLLRQKMGECACERAQEQFGVDRTVQKTQSLYESLLGAAQ